MEYDSAKWHSVEFIYDVCHSADFILIYFFLMNVILMNAILTNTIQMIIILIQFDEVTTYVQIGTLLNVMAHK